MSFEKKNQCDSTHHLSCWQCCLATRTPSVTLTYTKKGTKISCQPKEGDKMVTEDSLFFSQHGINQILTKSPQLQAHPGTGICLDKIFLFQILPSEKLSIPSRLDSPVIGLKVSLKELIIPKGIYPLWLSYHNILTMG